MKFSDIPEKHIIRFFNKTKVTDKCWIWTGYADPKGYGRIFNPDMFAHRLSFVLFNEVTEINSDIAICHSCDNRICVNPLHLWSGSKSQNIKDMWQKNRGAKGSKHGSAVINENIVLQIRELLARNVTGLEIARRLNIGPNIVYKIKHNRKWRHV